MLIGNSLPKLIFIRSAILGIRLIAPASIVYCATVFALRPLAVFRSSWLVVLTTWCSAESLFYLCGYLPLKLYLQKTPPRSTQLNEAERQELITKCFDRVSDSDRYMAKWFLDAPDRKEIKRENVKDFLAWSLLDARYQDLTDAEDFELDGYVGLLEQRIGLKFQPVRVMC